MKKRIVICSDGTWNRPEQDPKKDIPTLIREGKPRDQAVAIALETERKRKGKSKTKRRKKRRAMKRELGDGFQSK